MSFITTPTTTWLREALKKCDSELLIASPFTGDALNNETRLLPREVQRRLITRTDLPVFASRASNIESLIQFSECGGEVLSLPGLHAKVYVIDDSMALVTSANATFSGMNRNWECGVAIEDPAKVAELKAIVIGGFGSKVIPQSWSSSALKSLRPAIAKLRTVMDSPVPAISIPSDGEAVFNLPFEAWNKVLAALPGWPRMTLEAIFSLHIQEFEIDQVYESGIPLARIRYPQNQHTKAKFRQQLQRLRDMGFLDFLGGGKYRLLMPHS